MSERITKCRGCYSSNVDEVLPLQSIPIGDHFSKKYNNEPVYPVGLTLCENCSLVQLTQKLQKQTVFKQYFFNSHTLPFDPQKLKSQVLDIAKVLKTVDGSLILEIGCGSGHLLQEFISQGAQAVGIEPSAAQANAASEHGIRIITGEFDEKTVDEFLHLYGRADLVVVDNSSKMQHPIHLSNVADPLNYVGNLANLIKPEGKVVVRAPYLGEIVNKGLIDYVYHEHQSYFSLISITNLFSRLGFGIVSARRCRDDDLNAQFVFSKNRPVVNEGLLENDFARQEGSLDLSNTATYRLLGKRLKICRKIIRKELEDLSTATIVGYGASVASVSMMYQCKIVDFIDFLVDDNKEKVGLFSPSANLRVKNPDSLYSDNVGTLVLLASRFADKIMARHRRFTGKVLIPRLGVERLDA